MATNKNQHYVPQCYLREFSMEGANSAINLFNIDRKKFIACAPIKNQCSKNYFYGKDLRIEKALQPIEGEYSSVLKAISKPGYCLTDDHRRVLARFWLLQNMRTEAASRRSILLSEEMSEGLGGDAVNFKVELEEAVQNSMNAFIHNITAIDDLKVCLIKNKSNIDFITSDDPAVLTNKWYLVDDRAAGKSFGFGSAGNVVLLPLTPKIFCLGYDGSLYNVSHKKGWLEIKDEQDVQALNEHQFLNCRANIFVRDLTDKDKLLAAFECTENNRPESRHKINYAILDSIEDGEKTYKCVSAEEARGVVDSMVHCQRIDANPNLWPKQIRWRPRGFAYTNDSGAGFIRQELAKTMPNEGFRKERINK